MFGRQKKAIVSALHLPEDVVLGRISYARRFQTANPAANSISQNGNAWFRSTDSIVTDWNAGVSVASLSQSESA